MMKWLAQGLHDLFLVELKLEPAFPVSRSRAITLLHSKSDALIFAYVNVLE